MRRALEAGISWAGLASGPFAWAVSTQLNYALVDWQCDSRVPLIPVLTLLLTIFAIAGGVVSWRAWSEGGASFKEDRERSTERFVAAISILAAALFALVIVLQGAASLVVGSCVR